MIFKKEGEKMAQPNVTFEFGKPDTDALNSAINMLYEEIKKVMWQKYKL